jgi:SAM-dependent methyltransferase
MTTWYEKEDFWKTWASFMFSKERWENATEEVTNLISLLDIAPGAKILDLCCGPGRHSLEFARRGYSVVGVDRTKSYLEKARKQAQAEGLKVEFIQKDMRHFRRAKSFDAVFNLFTSFGFFEDEKDDQRVAKNVAGSLRSGGSFVIDIIGKEIVARIFRERDWQEINGAIMLEERKVTKNWSWMENRWVLIKDGKVKEFRFSLRPYSASELIVLLKESGFDSVQVFGNLAGDPYDHKAKRLIAVARKV